MMNRKIRFGMVGGGRGAFIGAVHRIAAQFDGKAEIVCGVFSNTRKRSLETGSSLNLPQERIYRAYREMFKAEAGLPPEQRMDFVAIATPNNMHYPVAMSALDNGFHVVCDKPMAVNLDEAMSLAQKVERTGLLFLLTHNYTGYPMIREARDIVLKGRIGRVRRVVVEYPQGWLATRLETSGHKQAAWRTDPKQAGSTCCMGDIGSHCQSLAEYVTGLRITEVSADLSTFVKGRQLDDDGSVLLHFDTGAKGVLWASQIAVGEENGLSIRVYGETGGFAWHQQEPNTLVVNLIGKPTELRRTGGVNVGIPCAAATRLPAGHPEGFIEAFANLYRDYYVAMRKVLAGEKVRESSFGYPTVHDGLHGMAFIDAVVKSGKTNNAWTPLADALGPIRPRVLDTPLTI
jgi:predicted dehydrogenase